MTGDISRHSWRPKQNFTGVVRQQGRVPLDSDETESDDIGAWMLRQTVAETICSRGSPDEGFHIAGINLANGVLDFDIAAGSFYLGGARIVSDGDRWSDQPDWLTISDDDRAFALPLASPGAATRRTDLIWLSAWEQTVTATEDAELLEAALGGPDTTARRRMMWRVNLLFGVPATCPEAFADLVAREFPEGTLDGEQCEVLSNVRLTVGFTQIEPLEDLCRPNAQAGFLGARNEAFRIQVTAPGRFVWGRDNAAPLYRVQVMNDANGARRKISFLASPRDEFGWPLAGMTVELLRWGSLLANHEKAAEPLGLFLTVTSGFDPGDDNSILVGGDIDLALDAWFATPVGQAAIQPLDEDDVLTFFFLRVWTGGGDGAAADNPMSPGVVAPLGDTGLTLNFSKPGLAGDYWIVAARPNTPTRVTPWALLDNAPPAGPRRFIAPLALMTSTAAGLGEAVDCRHHFRPLCEVGACCRVTVGDGRTSFGDFRSIQAAIDRLPEEGGEVCIHPGDYAEHVTIANRHDITITGCGRTTRWTAEPGGDDPLLIIESSHAILVRRVAMINTLAEAILADIPEVGNKFGSSAITAEDLLIDAADRPAIHINGGRAHSVRRCRIALHSLSRSLGEDPAIGRSAAIFLRGGDLLVEQCRITLAPRRRDRSRTPAGGIHIGSGARGVMIRDNLIQGGNGHGVTLGTVRFVPASPNGTVNTGGLNHYRDVIRKNYSHVAGYGQGAFEYFGIGVSLTDQDCITIDGTPPDGGRAPGATPLFPESAGPVGDVRIYCNDILDMGYSGISTHVFSGLGRNPNTDAIAVERIEISSNRIERCVRNEIGLMSGLKRLLTGWGGIALSICVDATIRDNSIMENGRNSVEPISGIFIAIAENVKIERNRIEGNGADPGAEPLKPGSRGGIIVGLASGGVASVTTTEPLARRRAADRPALVVDGNIVDAPSGRALKSILLGPAIVRGNRLAGAGRSALASNPARALTGAFFGFRRAGGILVDAREDIDLGDYIALELIADALGGDAVNLINLCVAEDIASFAEAFFPRANSPQRLRGGEMLINDNQISLRRHSPALGTTVSAVLLLGQDDVSFSDNQVEVENEVDFFLTNTLAIGATLRIGGNRMQERLLPLPAGFLSIVSYGFLNNTSNNQTTHCILAAGLPAGRVVAGNTTIIGLFGRNICGDFNALDARMSSGIGVASGIAAL
jgi:hypothetical protein